ncbi:hypothetical protein [Actinoplanes aureus]|uniref:Uncharacterized protein n=1 Tax=Actinoplanes aureus TaxID=2792083 RepID=A0A931G2K9_9ACTN|nr:hypothetical protein [Actinoplanes aureus]MBG0569188.1 hypothetical protein [Actinoplanes aureus]
MIESESMSCQAAWLKLISWSAIADVQTKLMYDLLVGTLICTVRCAGHTP